METINHSVFSDNFLRRSLLLGLQETFTLTVLRYYVISNHQVVRFNYFFTFDSNYGINTFRNIYADQLYVHYLLLKINKLMQQFLFDVLWNIRMERI